MLSFKNVCYSAQESKADSIFILLPQGFDLASIINKYSDLIPDLDFQLKAHKFLGKEGQELFLATHYLGVAKNIFFVGIGNISSSSFSSSMDKYRNAIGSIINIIKKYQIKDLYLELDFSWITDKEDELSSLTIDSLICLDMASYNFNTFKNNQSKSSWSCNVEYFVKNCSKIDFKKIENEVSVFSEALTLVRNLSDLPPNIAHPEYINSKAEIVANKHNLTFQSFGESKAKDLGMGGFVAVGSGSSHEIKFFEMKYNSPNPDAKTVVLIGKGVTFDSGGISLKPSNSMSDMKYDMSGAATIIGIAQIIAQLSANVNVVCMAPLVENMPSGGCYRQDDIITHMNGITSEVKNTDAEGRLILADAICYAEKFYKPELIIDIATLTGACVVALGHFYTGMFSNNQKIADSLKIIGDRVGDYVWQLPCSDIYAKAIESDVADISNIGASNFGGGAISAAMFLKRFINQANWVHLDIAGTEARMPVKSYLGKGATGVTVRLLVNFLKEYF